MRILIVEDEERIALAIKTALELHNYAADAVFDSDSGLSAAIDPDYDLVILDRKLPGTMDGAEICRQVREAGVQTPILILTARGETDDKIYGLQSGADDYLVKPFSMRELITRVQVLLRRSPTLSGPTIKIGNMEVNTETFAVKRSGKNIKLSAREFKLLSYLVTNKGQTLSKDKIISHVWDGDTLIMPNTVEVYIGYLRKKIDKAYPDSEVLVHTVHGFGYKISESK
jgi:DNA-binding response OmpR family regulator